MNDIGIVALIGQGGVGVFPTDTIYGLVASAANQPAVQRLYELKHREQKPGTVIAANIQQLVDLGVPPESIEAVAHLWPNPVSLDLLVGEKLEYLSQGTGHCAFRVVADPELQAFLEMTGPLLTSSANHPGEPPAVDVTDAQAYFGDEVDFYVDGGKHQGSASTVVRYRDGRFETRRAGVITVDASGRIV
jgi:L-threonylcarbamoyladenylate synthase